MCIPEICLEQRDVTQVQMTGAAVYWTGTKTRNKCSTNPETEQAGKMNRQDQKAEV